MDDPVTWFVAAALILFAAWCLEKNNKACCAGCADTARSATNLGKVGGCASEGHL